MKETEALEVLMASIEGMILQLEARQYKLSIADQSDYVEGKLQALADVLEEAVFIKISFQKGNSK